MEKKGFSVILAVISLVLVSAGISQAVPTVPDNRNFNDGLNGWHPSGNVTDGTDGETGFAFFSGENYNGNSSLWQEFILPDDALSLSFELKPVSAGEPGCDIFTASLLPGNSNFYFWSNEGGGTGTQRTDAEVIDLGGDWRRITLNVSSLHGQGVHLAFNLSSDDDDVPTWVSLDNIVVSCSLSVVPAPGALFLALTGASIVGWLRRTKILR